jgi:hypothetical protein
MLDREFNRRVAHNRNVFAHMLSNRTCRLHDLYTYDSEPGDLSLSHQASKAYDLLAAAASDCLVIMNKNGADGIYQNQAEVELKWKDIDRLKVFQSNTGTLYFAKDIYCASGKTTRAALRSAISAKYELHTQSNLISKNRMTILVTFDSVYNQLVDIWCLDGEKIVQMLSRSDKSRRDVKLSTFVNYGWSLPHSKKIGLENWENHLRTTAQII